MVVQDELGITLEKATEDVLGTAAKITVGKESCVIVGGGQYEEDIKARIAQIKTLAEQTEQNYELEKLNERVARLSGGVAVIQVCSAVLYFIVCVNSKSVDFALLETIPFRRWNWCC